MCYRKLLVHTVKKGSYFQQNVGENTSSLFLQILQAVFLHRTFILESYVHPERFINIYDVRN